MTRTEPTDYELARLAWARARSRAAAAREAAEEAGDATDEHYWKD